MPVIQQVGGSLASTCRGSSKRRVSGGKTPLLHPLCTAAMGGPWNSTMNVESSLATPSHVISGDNIAHR